MTHCRIVQSHTLGKKNLYAGGSIFVVALLAFVAIPSPAIAAFTDYIGSIVSGVVGWIVQMVVRLLGWIFVKMAHILINRVAPYNDFVTAAPVGEGWVIVRDISNMFFIVILLAIAFGTMFGREEYDYKKKLPRLLIMAIFINFSRTITGLIIDAAQVAMLTFVNAFQAAAGGNLATGLGINQLFEIVPNAGAVGASEAVLGYLLALVLMAVAVGVLGIILVTLVYRIVMLWTITILSPAAFLMSTFERGKKYYTKWWDQLICWALSGPILAFFLWLALATMSEAGGSFASTSGSIDEGPNVLVEGLVTQAATEENIIRFIVGIMMLLVGVQTAQELGCAKGVQFFGGLGKQALGYAKAGLTWAGKKTAGGAWRTATLPARALMTTGRAQTLQKGIYGAIGATVAPGWASRRLEAMQTAPSKAYGATETAAARALAAAPDQFLGMVRRDMGLQTPEKNAVYAARLKTALTNPRARAALVKKFGDTPEGNAKADDQMKNWFEEYTKLADTSGNKDIIDGAWDVKKKNPHLIKDPQEKRKVASMLSGQAALDMSAAALKDADVVSGLSGNAKKFIDERGSEVQKKNLAEGEKELASGLRPDLITDTTERQAQLAKLGTEGRLGDLKPEVVASVFPDMDDTQRQKAIEKLDVTKMSPEALTQNNGALAAFIARNASTDQIGAVKKDKQGSASFIQGLIAYRMNRQKEMKAKTAAGIATPQDRADFDTEMPQIATALMSAGTSPVEAFEGNYDQLAQSLSDPSRQMAIISNISVETVQSDATTRDVLAETIDMASLLTMLSLGDKNEKKKGELIAQTIIARAQTPKTGTLTPEQKTAEDRIKKIADELLLTQPTIKRLMAQAKAKVSKPKDEGGTPPTT